MYKEHACQVTFLGPKRGIGNYPQTVVAGFILLYLIVVLSFVSYDIATHNYCRVKAPLWLKEYWTRWATNQGKHQTSGSER